MKEEKIKKLKEKKEKLESVEEFKANDSEVKELVKEEEKKFADLIIPQTREIMLTYSKEQNGENWVELAMAMSRKKGWQIIFR